MIISHNPTIEATDARSPESSDSHTSYDNSDETALFENVNTIQIPDPAIFNRNPLYSSVPPCSLFPSYAMWEQEMKEKLKVYSRASFSIRMKYVLSRLGDRPKSHLESRMRDGASDRFTSTDEMFEVLEGVYGDSKGKGNKEVRSMGSGNWGGLGFQGGDNGVA
ncbi:hypothetical protein BOTCAL_0029g00020 [Botryotinia calthae]|uniref:Uncharacterized protein n=1 Tax=Botryotinia calthae TaxID=38488 RepID=A0A4Y8DDR2_9HELO|nr:hypothetical protein BOTCAL_0029g00020 [Botryotinia calthae]